MPKKEQKKGSAEAGAGEETARESRSTMTSGQSQTSGWIAAIDRGSARVAAKGHDMGGWQMS